MTVRTRARTGVRAMIAAVAVAALVAAGSPGASAAPRTRAPKSPPAPAAAPAPAVVGSVTVNESNSAQFTVTNPYESGVEVLATISGPGAPQVFVDIVGIGRAMSLQPSSTYTVTVVRNRFYDPATNRAVNVNSSPTTFSFTTLSLAQSRPSTPVISLASQTATTTTLAWAPSTDNTSASTQIRYVYQVNGGSPVVTTCGPYCFGATGTVVQRPAAGSSITVTVSAIDAAGVVSLPSNQLVING